VKHWLTSSYLFFGSLLIVDITTYVAPRTTLTDLVHREQNGSQERLGHLEFLNEPQVVHMLRRTVSFLLYEVRIRLGGRQL
jgi:hypothetical protein